MDIKLQLELSFKVVDENENALKDATIKIKNDKDSEELKTDDNGEVKAVKKYAADTKFSVEISKEGYKINFMVIKPSMNDRKGKNFSFCKRQIFKHCSKKSLSQSVENEKR